MYNFDVRCVSRTFTSYSPPIPKVITDAVYLASSASPCPPPPRPPLNPPLHHTDFFFQIVFCVYVFICAVCYI